MAKLGIALCILIVACGVQGSLIPSSSDTLTSWVEQYNQVVDFVTEKLEEGRQKLEEFIATATARITGTIQDISDEWRDEVEKIANATEIGRECVASSVDIRETVRRSIFDSIKCITDAVEDIRSEYNTIKSSLESFKSTVSDLQNEIESCKSSSEQWTETLACYYGIITSSGESLASDSVTLLQAVVSFGTKVASLQTTAESCFASRAIAIVTEDAAQSIAEIRQCIRNAETS